MPVLSSCLSFNDICCEAFTFYAALPGGTIERMVSYGESPLAAGTPLSMHNAVLHVALTIGTTRLPGGDVTQGQYTPPQGFSVTLNTDTPGEAERIFAGLADNGKICMPLAPTFRVERFGIMNVRFGISWMVNCDRREE
jgi:PhnB protein